MSGDDTTPVGGFAFFASLAALTVIGLFNFYALWEAWREDSLRSIGVFCGSLFAGAISARWLIRGRIGVFIHELKHAILSNLVGNKDRGIKVRKDSGHFQYSYTKQTAPYNAFIALAPYWLPLMTAGALIVAATLLRSNHLLQTALLAFAFGADLALGIRDISPHQTDLSNLRGGYVIGVIYISAANLTILTLLLAWSVAGKEGLLQLVLAWLEFGRSIAAQR